MVQSPDWNAEGTDLSGFGATEIGASIVLDAGHSSHEPGNTRVALIQKSPVFH